jgi:iron(III) transport system substrate-binding protein
MTWVGRAAAVAGATSLALVLTACGGSDDPSGSGSTSITLYTCVSDTTIGPVIKAYEKAHPGDKVKLFRAPTGELNARVAGDVRSGGLRADVVWACDPLTMQDYVDQHLVGGWTPTTSIPSQYRTDDYVGVALLYMVAVSRKGVAPVQAWTDLSGSAYGKGVAVPDPAVAASALGALGYFSANPDYGVMFYADLKKNGGTQVSTPDDVVTGVAEGTYDAGITTANSAYAAKSNGSPIEVTWPSPGAVGIYGPVGLAEHSDHAAVAKRFISYVTSRKGQEVIAKGGSYPTLPDVPGPTKPADAAVVLPNWASLASSQDSLLERYQKIFGG